MDKLIKLPALVAVFAALALAGMIGIFAFNAAQPAQADGHPMLTMAVFADGSLTLTFDQDLDGSSLPFGTDFLVELEDADSTASVRPASVTIDGANVILTYTEPASIDTAAAGSFTYTPAAGRALQDEDESLAYALGQSHTVSDLQTPGMPTGLKASFTTSSGGTAIDQVTLEWTHPVYLGNVATLVSSDYRVKRGSSDYSAWLEAVANDAAMAELAFSALVTAVNNIDGVSDVTEANLRDETLTFQVRVEDGTADGDMSEASAMAAARVRAIVATTENEIDVPNKPNKSDGVDVTFMAPDTGINAGDYITIVLHEDFQVPDDISESHVSLAGSVTNQGGTPATPAPTVFSLRPASVTVDDTDKLTQDRDDGVEFGGDADWWIQIQIPDTYTADNDNGAGNQGLGGEVTVTIEKAAGIKAPKEAGDYGVGFAIAEEPEDATEIFARAQVINRLVELSEEKKGRGANIEATAKGFEVGTVYFWRDGNLNNMLDGTEDVLCHATVDDDHVATCEFELTNPPFMPGIGTCTGSDPDCNLVQAYDGVNRSNYAKASTGDDLDPAQNNNEVHENQDDVIYLDKSISISPEAGNPGDKITLTLRDFPDGRVGKVSVGGVDADYTAATISNGGATSTVTIPDRAQTGIRQFMVEVHDASGKKVADDDTEITIGGADLTATPETVIPGQDVVLTGSGYYGGSCIRGMTLGGILTEFESCTGRDAVEADNNGNWSYTVEVPVNGTTADAEGGTLTLRVADAQGRVGSMQLPFMAREVTMTPSEGHPGTPMVLQGSGFPVDADIDVQYGEERPDGVDADSGGSWRHTMKVPEDVGIPSTNVVTVSFEAGTETVTETFTHRVPGATITLDPAMGPEGGIVTLTAGGFSRYTALDELMVDGRDATPSPSPSTDRNGNVTFTFRIPGSDPGVVNVAATFDDTTASTTFTVTEGRGVVDGSVETILASVISEDALDRVFVFDNETKEWLWHISDPAFASTNTLTGLSSGDLAWIKVSKSVTADVLGRSLALTCINEGMENEDCWNQVSIP